MKLLSDDKKCVSFVEPCMVRTCWLVERLAPRVSPALSPAAHMNHNKYTWVVCYRMGSVFEVHVFFSENLSLHLLLL